MDSNGSVNACPKINIKVYSFYGKTIVPNLLYFNLSLILSNKSCDNNETVSKMKFVLLLAMEAFIRGSVGDVLFTLPIIAT